jgi:GT2 family glycosyltransferase
VLKQKSVEDDVVVVGNGWQPKGLPEGVRSVSLKRNEGIPTGRNAGVAHVRGDLLLFLDDDARLRDNDALCRMAEMFAEQPDLAVIQPRVLDPAGKPAPRRWTPRLRVGDPAHSSDVTALWEGAVAVRRDVFTEVGGWPNEFFFMHEGIDLAWAVWNTGARVHYAGDLIALHPAVSDGNHSTTHRQSARNRVFLARRRLPVLIGTIYLGVWAVLTVLRERNRAVLAQSLQGAIEGFRENPGRRQPMSWHTVWRMTRAGRPPIV